MSLIGNYSVLNKNPGRYLAGTSSCDRMESNKAGASRNFYISDKGKISGVPLFSYSRQVGYAPPYTWNISPKDGGMAMSNYSSGDISFSLVPQYPMIAALSGSGSFIGIIYGLGNIICALTGSSTFTVAITSNGNMVVSVLGSGSLIADITGKANSTISLTGSSSFTASASLFLSMLAALSGSGTLNATSSLLVNMLCDFVGGGTLTANINGQKGMSASITGSGNLSADIKALANMVSALSGSGVLNGGTGAVAQMSIDIVVTGTGLTTDNVGKAIWESILSQFSANPNSAAAKLLAAGSAGDPWGTDLPAAYTGTQAGNILSQIQILVDELNKIQGLNASAPMTVTQTTRHAGGINLVISGDGVNSTTVTRQ